MNYSSRLKAREAETAPKAPAVDPGEDADARLVCDTGTFLRWTLGLNGFAEWKAGVAHTLTREQEQLLAVLFRREPCASGPWG